jgi:hypothetical protein
MELLARIPRLDSAFFGASIRTAMMLCGWISSWAAMVETQ